MQRDRLIEQQLAEDRVKEAYCLLDLDNAQRSQGRRILANTHRSMGYVAPEYLDLRSRFVVDERADGRVRGIKLKTTEPLKVVPTPLGEGASFYWQQLGYPPQLNDQELFNITGVHEGLGEVSTAEDTAGMLAEHEVLLTFALGAESVHVFVVLADGEISAKKLPIKRHELKREVSAFVAQLGHPQGDWRATSRRLYDALIAPIEPLLDDARRAIVIAPAELSNIPFAALLTNDGQPLIKTIGVTYMPSAVAFRELVRRPLNVNPPRILAIGNAIYPEGFSALPSAENEADTVSVIFDDSRVLIGADANEIALRRLAPSYNILHFATHGALVGGPLPMASSLLMSPEGDTDGFLSAAEVSVLDLKHAHLVTLSACETSATADGTESISLADAFLIAGAPVVIGSLWQIADDSTTELMLAFYQRFIELGAADALRSAQLALLEDQSYAHPYFWAAFTLFGDPR